MKKLLFTLLIPLLLFCGCTDNGAQRIAAQINENTNLELGFLEDVSEKDLSSLVLQNDWFGGTGYYNSGYVEGDIHYVFYLVTAYPDYADGGSYVTRITCTDPDVTFFGGYTVNDSEELFKYLAGEGFTVKEYSETFLQAKKGKFIISFFEGAENFFDDAKNKTITFYYQISNRNKIDF